MSITQDFSKIALIFIISKILKVGLKMKTILIKDRMKIELLQRIIQIISRLNNGVEKFKLIFQKKKFLLMF